MLKERGHPGGCCFTALLLYCGLQVGICFAKRISRVVTYCAAALLLLTAVYKCFTAALLRSTRVVTYDCAAALLLLYCCFTAVYK
jgi:hypothetical protein